MKKIVLFLAILFLLQPLLGQVSQKYRDELFDFLERGILEENLPGIPKAELVKIFKNVSLYFYILKFKSGGGKIPEKNPYLEKINDNSIARGIDFYKKYRDHFEKASVCEYPTVPIPLMLAYFWKETNFGSFLGVKNESLIGYLYTWAIAKRGPERWREDAKRQLLFLLSNRKNIDPFSRGSYMACVGLVQFNMESAFRFGIDGNKDGKVDLFDPVDAIYSLANYIRKKGEGFIPVSQYRTKCEIDRSVGEYNLGNFYREAIIVYTGYMTIALANQ